MEKNKIYLKNCLEFLDGLKDESVDLILTDPPYNISRKNNFKSIGRSGIDFGEWDKNFDQITWLKKLNRIMSKNGSVIIFNDWKNLGLISSVLENEGFVIKDILRWIKSNPMPRNINRRYVTDYEFALWVTKKGAKWIFNKEEGAKYQRSEFIAEDFIRPEFKSSIFEDGMRIHPTQKAVSVFERIIKIHSNKNDLVLDCFMGSATTAIACMKSKRNFIGCEIDKKYFDLSNKRIQHFKDYFKKKEKPLTSFQK
jgi:DNA modification methylase